MDLRVLAGRQHDRVAEAILLRLASRTEQDRERRRVDELGVAEVDDDVVTLLEQQAELTLEPTRRVRIMLSDEGDDCCRGIPGS